jgi:hypothetical protein
MSLTKLSLAEFFPARESLVSDILATDCSVFRALDASFCILAGVKFLAGINDTGNLPLISFIYEQDKGTEVELRKNALKFSNASQ